MDVSNKTSFTPTKTSRPRSNRPLLRPRLFQRLDELRHSSLLWLAGPPGCGKTTLVSSYLTERAIGGLWIQLNSDDADIATFFFYLGQALDHAAVRDGLALPTLLPAYLPNVMTFTRRCAEVIAARLDRNAAIVIDNYEQVPEGAVLHDVIRELAASLPQGLNLFVLSRTEPPPTYARLRLNESVAVLEGQELNLTRDEALTFAIAQRSNSFRPLAEEGDSTLIDSLLLETDGWLAGFALLLAESNPLNRKRESHEKSQQLLFDYFATELFGGIELPMQDALLRTSLLPTMTVGHAVRISGNPEVGKILADLRRRNCLVVQHGHTEPVYEFHALFRSFLLNRAAFSMPPDDWRTLHRQSADLLAHTGHVDSAARLYRTAKDWEALSALALREAPALIATGRHRTLENWLVDLPDDVHRCSAWLHYWQGIARLPFDPVSARGLFEKAYEGFRRDDDIVGLYTAWAGAMESFFFEWRDFRLADKWITEFELLRARHPEFPSRAVELRTYWAMGTLLHRQPQHPMLPAWAERAKALLDPSHRDLSVLLSGYLVIWFLWRGEVGEARTIIDRITTWTTPDMSPMVLILWSCATGFYYSVRGDIAACQHLIESGLGLADQTGLHAFDFLLAAQMARCSLVAGEPEAADTWMIRMSHAMRSHSHIDGAFYQYLQGSAAAQRGAWQVAIDHGRGALAMALESGVPFMVATSHIALARSLLGRGNDFEWSEHVQAARSIGQAMSSRVVECLCLEVESRVDLNRGAHEALAGRLVRALELSALMDGATWNVAGPQASAELYQHALATGIEVEHVQRMIRRFHIAPPEPATVAEAWPWPIRIYTLGRFEILLDDHPLRALGKSQHRPLELLKCLLALGGQAIHQERVTDALWPDAEGDAADQALRTTLHRLRKLLQNDQAVHLEDRHLHIRTQWIWADCLAFDRAAHLPHSRDPACLHGILSRYRGPFLDGEAAPWALVFRERLHAQFKQMSERLGEMLERDGDWLGAVDCYIHAIEVDPLAEGFYRRLMGVYTHLGRRSEARSVYHRCQQALLARRGVIPAPETQALYQQLADH